MIDLKKLNRYIYQNELYKVCFQRDMAHGDFKICLEEHLPKSESMTNQQLAEKLQKPIIRKF